MNEEPLEILRQNEMVHYETGDPDKGNENYINDDIED